MARQDIRAPAHSPRRTDAGAILSLGNRDWGGWTQLDIGRMDDDRMADQIRLAWRQVAPKRPPTGGMA